MELVQTFKRSMIAVVAVTIAVIAIYIGFFGFKNIGIAQNAHTRVKFDVPSGDFKRKTLDNGMNIIAFKTDRVPKVLVQIAYDIGSAVENQGELGLAHLLEHMIFKGTDKLSEADIDVIARKYSASFNAFTTNDVTSYHFEVDKNNWHHFLPILSDCMQNARFDDQHLNSEVKAVIQELNMYKDIYWRRMLEKVSEFIFPPNHPYHHPVIGYKEDLAEMNGARLKVFYKKYYQPRHATLFIVGDIDLDDAIAKAEVEFADIPEGDEAMQAPFPEYTPDLTTNYTSIYEEISQEKIGLYWRVPGLKHTNDALVDAIAYLLGGSEGSRLYRRLIDEEKVANTVQVLPDLMMEDGIIFVFVDPKPGMNQKCRELVIEELGKVIKDGFSEEEMGRMQISQVSDFFYKLESLSNFTTTWIYSFFATRDEADLFKYVDKLYAVTSANIQDYVLKNLDPFMVSQIDLLKLPESKKGLWQQAMNDSKKLEATILEHHKRTVPNEEPRFALTMPEPEPLSFEFPQPTKHFTLDNGLEVVLHKIDALPLVTINCSFRDGAYFGGSRDGQLVALMMDMLIEGSEGYKKHDNVSFFENYGANYNYGGSGARLSMLNADVLKTINRFFHVLTKPDFDSAALDKLKKMSVAAFERAQDSPSDVASRVLKNEVYAGTTYAWTFDDAIKFINDADVSLLKKLHEKYVRPENMVLSIAGAFDLDHMESLIKSATQSWKGQGAYVPLLRGKAQFDSSRNVDIKMLRDQAFLMLGKPSVVDVHHEDYEPLSVLNLITFYSLGSRLYELRDRTGLFYRAGGAFTSGASKEPGYDYVAVLLSPETFEQAETFLRQMFDTLAQEGVTNDELKSAQQMRYKYFIDMVSSVSNRSAMFGGLCVLGLPFDYYQNAIEQVKALTSDDLSILGQKYSSAQDMVRVRVGRVS